MIKQGSIAAAVACAALAMPVLARADDAMGAMKHDPSMMATMLCRAAHAGEKATAMTMGDAKTPIVCKTMQPAAMMKKGSGPDLSHALSADQVDAAWRAYLQSVLAIPGGTGGG